MSLKRQTAQQTTLHSEHSSRIGLLTSTEDFEASWNSRQAEHDVDETTQERSSTPHGKDSIDEITTVIDTVGEADDKRSTSLSQWSGTPSTGNVPTEDNRSVVIHNNQPIRLYLHAKRRTTFTVQPLRKGSVDQERLRSDKTCFPLRTLRRLRKSL